MPRETPKPRTTKISLYSPGNEPAQLFQDGSWLEAECFAYPEGEHFSRRAYVNFGDQFRVVECGVPDTYFSIPARVRIKGARLKGFITVSDGKLVFHEEEKK
jgi:hypothetical protein